MDSTRDDFERIEQLDKVQLKTTRRVRYVSAPKNVMPKPDGVWSVVAIIDSDVLVAKDSALIRIPITDVVKVGSYGVRHILQRLETEYGKGS